MCVYAGLTSMLCGPYICLPPVKYMDHCQLAPTDLQEWLREHAAIPAPVHYEHQWGLNYRPGLGLPLECFTGDQQRHRVAHRMRSLPTMMVLAEHCAHRDIRLSMQCLMCDSGPETARYPARKRLHTWLTTYVARPRQGSRRPH